MHACNIVIMYGNLIDLFEKKILATFIGTKKSNSVNLISDTLVSLFGK